MQNALAFIQFPNLSQVRVAANWLVNHRHQNPPLEYALSYFLKGQIPLQAMPATMAIAHASSTNMLAQESIRGIVMAQAGNTIISLESSDRQTAEQLFQLTQSQGPPCKIQTSSQVKRWLRPSLLRHYSLEREYNSLVMVCTQSLQGGAGRWALPRDKPTLQAYADAYLAERGTGNSNQNWDDLIQQKRIAVLEHQEQLVAVVKWGTALRHVIVTGVFTFPQFRRQGFARRLMSFLIYELLQEASYPAVKLWVDDDNFNAIALYKSLGFQEVGDFYSGYFAQHPPTQAV